jgi:hypothetical protein
VKIIIGKNPDQEFRLIADDGTDITHLLAVTKVVIVATAGQPTRAALRMEQVEVEVDVRDDKIEDR